MKRILSTITTRPRTTLLRGGIALVLLVALVSIVGPIRIEINIQFLGESAEAAPAAILPTVTPPPPPPVEPPTTTRTAPPVVPSAAPPTVTGEPATPPAEPPTVTEEPPVPPIEPSTAARTAEPVVPGSEPPLPPAEPPAEEEHPERETREQPTPQPPLNTPEPSPTIEEPSATSIPEPPVSTGIPTSAPPLPDQQAQTTVHRRIDPAPKQLPATADPQATRRLWLTYLPLMGMAILLFIVGMMLRRSDSRQPMVVALSSAALGRQAQDEGRVNTIREPAVPMGAEAIYTRWQSGTSIAELVEEFARANPSIPAVALTLAIQQAIQPQLKTNGE